MSTPRPNRSSSEIDAILRRIAQDQIGLVTVPQATTAGVDRHTLAHRRRSGALVPVFAEVMRLGGVPSTPEQRILAASLAVPRSLVGATSAAVVHGLPVPAKWCNEHPVVIVGGDRSARTAGVRVIRSSAAMPTKPWFTTRVATPAATLAQLPRFVDDSVLERCLDHCLAHGLVSVRAVNDVLDRLPSRAIPGSRVLRGLLAERSSGIGHRSGVEQTVAGWLDEAGLVGWSGNHRVSVGVGRFVEVDFGWPSSRIALEVSPFVTHGSRAQQIRDAERRKLLVIAGWRVVEATDPDLAVRHAFAGVVAALTQLKLCVA